MREQDPYEEFEEGRCTVKIFADEDPINPVTDYDEMGIMACWHRRYNLGHEQPKDDAGAYLNELARLLVSAKYPDSLLSANVNKILNHNYARLPLYLYDHSGITISTTPFSCQWDSGQVGFIYTSLKRAIEWLVHDKVPQQNLTFASMVDYGKERMTLRAAAEKRMVEEVKQYDDYLTGNCWGYVVDVTGQEDSEWEDSCWGYSGDVKYCREEAVAAAKSITERLGELEFETQNAANTP